MITQREINKAKTIKFNSILDNYPIRNLECLQEYFSIEEVLHYFSNGLLLRWLDVKEYRDQFDTVSAIAAKKDRRAIRAELICIFEIKTETEDIEKSISILSCFKKEKIRNIKYRKVAIL